MRLWLSVSWGLGSMAMGYVNDKFGFSWNFVIYGVFSFIQIIVVWHKIPAQTSAEAVMSNSGRSPRYADLRGSLVRWAVFIFLIELIIFGMAIGCVERLLFIYLQNELGASAALCGQCVAMNVIIELPIFWYYREIIGFFGRYARQLSPEGWGATVQTIFRVAYYSFGVGVGAVVGGYFMQKYGAKWMYRHAAMCIFAVFCIRVGCFFVDIPLRDLSVSYNHVINGFLSISMKDSRHPEEPGEQDNEPLASGVDQSRLLATAGHTVPPFESDYVTRTSESER
eukprot:jgi/Bigna1/125735/aug1.1_g443